MRRTLSLISVLALALTSPVLAETFTAFSINGSPAARIRVVLEARAYGLDLTLINQGGPEASLVGVYFDDRSHLLNTIDFISTPGVDFDLGGSPPVLPEGETLQPPFHTDLFVTAASPPPQSGVNPGERLKLKMTLRNGADIHDVLDAIEHTQLRIGIRGIAGPGAAVLIVRRCPIEMADRASISAAEAQANDGSSLASVSDDGLVIAFWSKASNLVANDTNGRSDVFIRNRSASWTTRVSVSTGGYQGNGDSVNGQISAGGRFVVFSSDANNLVAGDTNGRRDIFIRDRYAFTTARLSMSTAGIQANGPSDRARVSADGRFVVFESLASNLVPGDTNGAADIFLRDRATGQTLRVSTAQGGAQANGSSFDATLSDNGMAIAFSSDATNLVPADTNGAADVFLRDRALSTTTRLSIATGGTQANGPSLIARLSPDGRWTAFTSSASNLIGGDTNAADDVYVRDRIAGTTLRISVGAAQGNGGSTVAGISSGGRYMLFNSTASNLVGGDTNSVGDAFIRDRWASTTRRVSVGCLGQAATACAATDLSRDGQCAVFNSLAGNLVHGDAGYSDVFLVERE